MQPLEEIEMPRDVIAPEDFEGVVSIFAPLAIPNEFAAPTIPVTPDEVEMIRSLVLGWLFNVNGARLGKDPELFEETRVLLNRWAPVQDAFDHGTILTKGFVVECLWDARDYYAGRPDPDEECLTMLDSLLGRLEAAGANSLPEQLQAAGAPRPVDVGPGPPDHGLTARQREVLGLLAEGKVHKQIASELGLSVSTVRTHLHGVYVKLGVADRAQAVLIATKRGWLDPRWLA
jgi:DNA-binding CsgD family transcriptional regulator